MCMVELPPALAIADTPGVPGAGVRQQLRERFKIEAAVANFGAAPTTVISNLCDCSWSQRPF